LKKRKSYKYGIKRNKILISNDDINSEYKSNDIDYDLDSESKSVQITRIKPQSSSNLIKSKNVIPFDEKKSTNESATTIEQNYFKSSKSINNNIDNESIDLMSNISMDTMKTNNNLFQPRTILNSGKLKLEPIKLKSQLENNLILENINVMSSLIEKEIDNFSIEISQRKKKKKVRTRRYDVKADNNNTLRKTELESYRPLSAKRRIANKRPISGPGEVYKNEVYKNEDDEDNSLSESVEIGKFPMWHID